MARPPLYWLDFFFALPFDCGLGDNTVKRGEVDFDSPGLGRIEGWEDATINPATGVPEYPEPGVWPSTTLAFRRLYERRTHPLEAQRDAFGRDLAGERSVWGRLRGALPRLSRRGDLQPYTMMRLIRLDSPPATPISNAWLGAQFARGLRHLNDVLVGLSWVAGDPAIVPMHPLALAPLIEGYQTDVGARLEGRQADRVPFVLALHPDTPRLRDLTEDEIDYALFLAPDPRLSRPLLPIVEFLVTARGALGRGDNGQAVIESAVAAELLVNKVIREVGPRLDPDRYRERRLEGVLDAPFRARLSDHFAKLLGSCAELGSGDGPIGGWWERCYRLRNRVAHEGYRPTDEEATRAVEASEALQQWAGRIVTSDPGLGTDLLAQDH